MASWGLHHGFIMASSWLHHGFMSASSWLHHGFIMASSWLHEGFIMASWWLHDGFMMAVRDCRESGAGQTCTITWNTSIPPGVLSFHVVFVNKFNLMEDILLLLLWSVRDTKGDNGRDTICWGLAYQEVISALYRAHFTVQGTLHCTVHTSLYSALYRTHYTALYSALYSVEVTVYSLLCTAQ